MSTEERLSWPGYSVLATSTHDWKQRPAGPYVWVAYLPPDEDRLSTRLRGFAPTLADAVEVAEHALVSAGEAA